MSRRRFSRSKKSRSLDERQQEIFWLVSGILIASLTIVAYILSVLAEKP